RLGAGGRGNDVAGVDRKGFFAETVFSSARDDKEELIHHVVAVEWKRFLARRHDVNRTAESVESEQRTSPSPLHRKLLAVASVEQRHVVNVNDSPLGHPANPADRPSANARRRRSCMR